MSRRLLSLVVLAIVALVTLAACDSGGSSSDLGAYTVEPAEAVTMVEDGQRTVIDVRTPAEFAEEHIVGAINIDVDGATFSEQIDELNPEQPYLVYCRSGRRSAIAAEQMAGAGIKDIADAGGLADLERAGAPVE